MEMSTLARIHVFAGVFLALGLTLIAVPLSATSTEQVLYGFGQPTDGANPSGSLVVDNFGNLYGVALGGTGTDCLSNHEPYSYGCGVVFELTPAANGQWSEKILYSFTGQTDGSQPSSSLILDAAGNLYGTTYQGGIMSGCSNWGCGVVFRLSPDGKGNWTETVLHAFGGSPDGAGPGGTLAMDKSGSLYGVTGFGGSNSDFDCNPGGCGTAYQLSPSSGQWTETILYNFCSLSNCSDGLFVTGVIMDGEGNLYGTSDEGGTYGAGLVYELSPGGNGWTESILYSFCELQFCNDGNEPTAGVILDYAGNLFGTTAQGGSGIGGGCNGCGTVFELSPGTNGQWSESVLYNFCSLKGCTDGRTPTTGLTLGKSGTLYGNAGTIFQLQKSLKGVWKEKVLYAPEYSGSGVTFDAAGNLYGLLSEGGIGAGCENGQVYGCGEAYELKPGTNGTWTPSILHQFGKGSDGLLPMASLVFDSAGNAYGTTIAGGKNGYGVVFELSPNAGGTWTETVLFSFGSTDRYVTAGLIMDAAGNLYGTTLYSKRGPGCAPDGCGTIFELERGANGKWAYNTLYTFTGQDGKRPDAQLIFDSAGNLYGTTQLGGADGLGVVYELSPAGDGSWKESVVHSFYGENRDGQYPYSGVTFDPSGNLYGSTYLGGASDHGAVYQLVPGSGGQWTENVLYAFSSTYGGSPYGGVILDGSGNVYGTGAYNVYQLTPVSHGYWNENVLYTFCRQSCDRYLYAGVIFDGTGNLYGTTTYSVFELSPGTNGWTETTLHSFDGGSDGEGLYSGVVFGPDGWLYGTTEGGGTGGYGTAYSVTP
jgi:uncharacterized repeat protein (TIGR03803 family)